MSAFFPEESRDQTIKRMKTERLQHELHLLNNSHNEMEAIRKKDDSSGLEPALDLVWAKILSLKQDLEQLESDRVQNF